jgi:uncharacterized membrane protein HdeD (DUF308 family)
MTQPSVELSRTSFVLYVRGLSLIALAAVGVRWPEQTALLAMVAAGAVAGTIGIFEVAAALASSEQLSSRMFSLGHGLVFIGFGVVTAFIPVATVPNVLWLASAWLMLSAIYTVLLAARLSYLPRVPEALLLWGAITLGCMLVIAFLPASFTILGLCYWGALYVAALGFIELGAARWINRHILPPARRNSVAARASVSHSTEGRRVI